MIRAMPGILNDSALNPLQMRTIFLRITWLIVMSSAFTELFFLSNDDPVANKAYLVVLCAVIILGGNLIFPNKLLCRFQPLIRFLIWSLILGSAAFCLLLIHNNTQDTLSTSANMAVAVFNLSFMMCCTGYLFLATNKGSHPAQLTFSVVIISTTLPIWLGPWIDSLLSNQSMIDLIISASPLTHLAVMADFDYLRNQWFYQHTPYGALQYSYPTKLVSTICYAGLSLMLLGAAHLINSKVSYKHYNNA